MNMGEIIRNERIKKKYTMKQLGDMLGVGKSAINKWEKGHVQNIKRPMIIKMAEIFGCSPAYLCGYEDDNEDNHKDNHDDNYDDNYEDTHEYYEEEINILDSYKDLNKYFELTPRVEYVACPKKIGLTTIDVSPEEYEFIMKLRDIGKRGSHVLRRFMLYMKMFQDIEDKLNNKSCEFQNKNSKSLRRKCMPKYKG